MKGLRDQITYRSDRADRPTAGTEPGAPLEFLARLVTHIPDPARRCNAMTAGTPTAPGGTRRHQEPESPGTSGHRAGVPPWAPRTRSRHARANDFGVIASTSVNRTSAASGTESRSVMRRGHSRSRKACQSTKTL